ncbi:hypothetical protein AGOR_G00031880 [Albula goreensis]|uniref:Immunoglobulin domain-containing protein n=1 Tax=Albula goreensis TaxID=1534307 RepID=A0A8T3DVS9_9TELE|nr:hypothetical protein AGOR_G00031880 [Albula goreensis]
MTASLLLALGVLQVCNVGGASSVLNGTVGESIVLPAGVHGTVQAKLLQWSENNKVIIQSAKKRVQVLDQRLEGRVTMSNETGDLTISSLREEDSGKYVFNGVGSPSSESILPKEVQLRVYERISKVQLDSQPGGAVLEQRWTEDCRAEKTITLTVSPSREELYSCTASNPVSSLTGRVTVPPCQTHVDASPWIEEYFIYICAAVGGVISLMLIVTASICIKRKRKTGKPEEDFTVYAEVGETLNKGPVYGEPPPTANMSTCYDVIKGKGNATTPPTVYDTVKFDRATANTQYQDVL